jgi:hypothetical protein
MINLTLLVFCYDHGRPQTFFQGNSKLFNYYTIIIILLLYYYYSIIILLLYYFRPSKASQEGREQESLLPLYPDAHNYDIICSNEPAKN